MRIPKIALEAKMVNPYKRGQREDKLRNLQLSFYILIIRSTVSQKVREKTTSENKVEIRKSLAPQGKMDLSLWVKCGKVIVSHARWKAVRFGGSYERAKL